MDIGVLDIETGQDLERREARRRRRPLPVLTPIARIAGLQVKPSHVPAYGLDNAPMYAEVGRLGPRASRDASWDGLGAWTGFTPLCVRTLALSAVLFAALRRTPVVAAPWPAGPAPYGAEAAPPGVRPSTSGRAP